MAESHIDWEQFDMILGEPEEETVELLNEFQTGCHEIFSRLSGQTDLSTAGRDLHQLKGVCLNMGFIGLADLAASSEKAAKAGTLPSLSETIEAAQAELQASLEELRSERPGFFPNA